TIDITIHISSVPVVRVRLFDESREEDRDKPLDEERTALAALRQELTERERQLAEERGELDRLRREFTDIRQQLLQRYRQRRDRLAVQQETVKKAAHRLQERERELEETLRQGESTSGVGAELADAERRFQLQEQMF